MYNVYLVFHPTFWYEENGKRWQELCKNVADAINAERVIDRYIYPEAFEIQVISPFQT